MSITLNYWGGIRSRSLYINFVAKYFAVDMELKTGYPYPGTPEWAEATGFSAMGQLPSITDGDATVGQTIAGLFYIVKKFGLDKDLSMAQYGAMAEMFCTVNCLNDALGGAE
jgi:hypothetical protein